MKTIGKVILTAIFAIMLAGMSSQVYGQEQILPQRNIIKVKPLSFEFAYERALNSFLSVQVNTRLFPINVNIEGDGEGSVNFNNYRIMPEARFYIANRKVIPSGFFLAPYVKAGLTTFKAEVTSNSDLTENVKLKGTSLGAGFTLGWQWIAPSGFSIDTQFGWGYNRTNFKDIEVNYSDGTKELEPSPINNISTALPRFSFSIGYAF